MKDRTIKARHKDCGFEVEVIGAKGRAIWWCYKCQKELKIKDVIWSKGSEFARRL